MSFIVKNRLLWMLLTVVLSAHAEMRTFTDRAGNTLEAEVVGAYGSTVFLNRKKRGDCYVDIRVFSKPDIDYIIQWAISHEAERTNRPLVKDSDSELTQFLAKNLQHMVDGKLEKYDFSEKREPEFYIFYSSASWCGPCRAYSPLLVSFYNVRKNLMHQDNFEIILLSSDHSTGAMRKYMEDEKMQWPAIRPGKADSRLLRPFKGSGIPCLVVANRDGNVMYHSYVNGEYEGPRSVQKQLQKLLDLTRVIKDVES
jgi:thiol-disulfide isomerase/thioredoxin